MIRALPCLGLLLSLLLPGQAWSGEDLPRLEAAQLDWLGSQIYRNECGRRPSCLTAWNAGEDFPSLGIGHFIWYRAGQKERYTESFPALLAYMEARGAPAPAWIRALEGEAPWPDRESFQQDLDSPRMQELRDFLAEHMALQTAFIVERFREAPGALLAAAPEPEREELASRFRAVAHASPPHGLYALIDYIHFKGEGIAESERYQGRGWGLLQVLQGMSDDTDPLAAFAASARRVLAERVENAPPERRESRWLQGWHNRIATYLPPVRQ